MKYGYLKTIWHLLVLVFVCFFVVQYFLGGSGNTNEYPSKPIQVVVPFSPGGGTDTFARIIQKGIKDNNLMPQPLVIVNKPGGGTTIGSGYVKDARNDGYTLLCLHEAMITAFVTGQSPHGPEAFESIAATGEIIQILLVGNDSPFHTMDDFMAAANAQPDTIKVGVTLSMPTHFTGLMLEDVAPGVRFRYVSSGGGAARLSSLMGGHVDAAFFSVAEYIRFKANGLRPLATFGDGRHPGAPQVPFAKELGYEMSNSNLQYWWFPKDTDPSKIAYMRTVLEEAMQTDYVQTRLEELSILPQLIVGEELRRRIGDRMVSFAGMSLKQRVDLPNVAGWTVGAILVFGLGILQSRLRSPEIVPGISDAPVLRFDLARICLLAAALYVLVMALGWLSFVWATLLFVPFCGLTLSGFSSTRILYALEISLLISFGVHFIFTKLFLVSLP
ncbi:MAG: hypothetical protein CMI18_02140 [Opitutaceae bacterium]|nr:hypothetical protein [Opitutaceae bacterium]